MNAFPDRPSEAGPLKCPECRYPLKKRRRRTPDACEMICGGCGKQFDICDATTLTSLQPKDSS